MIEVTRTCIVLSLFRSLEKLYITMHICNFRQKLCFCDGRYDSLYVFALSKMNLSPECVFIVSRLI
jgi:hypothetical protein